MTQLSAFVLKQVLILLSVSIILLMTVVLRAFGLKRLVVKPPGAGLVVKPPGAWMLQTMVLKSFVLLVMRLLTVILELRCSRGGWKRAARKIRVWRQPLRNTGGALHVSLNSFVFKTPRRTT